MTKKTEQAIETSNLKAASENILYVLATIAGELEKPTDFETTKKNARFWNGYWTKNWTTVHRNSFNSEQGTTSLAPILSGKDLKHIRKVLDERGFKDAELPDISSSIDFQYTEFSKPINFTGFLFVKSSEFNDVRFAKPVNFKGANFLEYAKFGDAEFMGMTEFNNAKFMDYADFGAAIFHKRIFFNNVTFKTSMDFSTAQFRKHPPAFYDATMSENIIWTRAKFPSVKGLNARIAEEHKDAYERLALMMSKLEKDHDRHLFFRKEMQGRRQIDKNWKSAFSRNQLKDSSIKAILKRRIKWLDSAVSMLPNYLYELFSNYGYGFSRAFSWWSLHIIVGALFMFPYKDIVWAPLNPTNLATGFKAWGTTLSVSFANAHSFLGLSRYGMENVYTEFKIYDLVIPFHLTWTIQALLGVLFLFFLLLTLRNRFRLG